MVGILVALAWTHTRLLHPLPHASGSDAAEYLSSAAALWGDAPGATFLDWRKPWYPYLVASLGQTWGYVPVALAIARASLLTSLLGTAGFGRALGGPWAGGLAVVVAASWDPLVASAAWVNLYPLFGACAAVAWFGAAACARWPHPAWAAVAGVGGAAALAVDARGLTVLAPTAVVAGVSVLFARGWARRVIGVALLGGVLWGGQQAERHLDGFVARRDRTLEASVREQREITVREVRLAGQEGTTLQDACGPASPGGGSVLDLALDRCADAMRARNLEGRRGDGSLPPAWSLALLVPTLLPGRWASGARGRWAGLRGTLAAVGLFGGCVAAIWLAAGLAALPDRYLLPYAAPLCALVPVAALRIGALGRGLPRVGRLAPVVAAAAALAVTATEWPRLHHPVRASDLMARAGRDYAAVLAWVRDPTNEGALLYDCTTFQLGLVDLPRYRPYVGCPGGITGPSRQALWPIRRAGPSLLAVEANPHDAQPWVADVEAAGWERIPPAATLSPWTSLWRLRDGAGFRLEEIPPTMHHAQQARAGALGPIGDEPPPAPEQPPASSPP